MKLSTLSLTLFLCVTCVYGAELSIDQTAPTLVFKTHNGEHMVHAQLYHKLLQLSQTFRNQHELANNTKNINITYNNVNHAYYCINRKLPQNMVSYLTTANTEEYIISLSIIDAAKLYQEADFWEFDNTTLTHLCAKIARKLYDQKTLTELMTDREKYNQFISLCNPMTQDALAQALSRYLWSTVSKPNQTLVGHNDQIISLAIHTDGTLFSGSSNKPTIKVWKVNAQGNYECVQSLCDHTDRVRALTVSANGTLFSHSEDATTKIWTIDTKGTYECVQTLLHTGTVNSLLVHEDGTLFSCLMQGTIEVCKPNAQGVYEHIQTLSGHLGSANALAVRADGTLFSASKDKVIKIWKINEKSLYSCIQTLTDHSEWVWSLAVHPDGTLFSGSWDGTIKIWKHNKDDQYICTQTLANKTEWGNVVSVHKDSTLFSLSFPTIKIWKLDERGNYECIQTLIDPNVCHYPAILTVHTNGTLLLPSSNNIIKAWKIPCKPLSLEQHLTLQWLRYNPESKNNFENSAHAQEAVKNQAVICAYRRTLRGVERALENEIEQLLQDKPAELSKFGPNGWLFQVLPEFEILTQEQQAIIKEFAASVYTWYKAALVARHYGWTEEWQNNLELLRVTIASLIHHASEDFTSPVHTEASVIIPLVSSAPKVEEVIVDQVVEPVVTPYQIALNTMNQVFEGEVAQLSQDKPAALSKFGPNGCRTFQIIPGFKTLTSKEQEAIKGLAASVYNWYKEAWVVRQNGLTAELQNRLDTLRATIATLINQ
ncbi:WD40 repeat domain-containing protein [Vermiphilus pyriformis]|nr:MAG: WD40 repeat domain-containing protein [Vermiphilus pyriformis]